MTETIKAEIWRQYSYYFECSHCGEVNDLGNDAKPDDDETIRECESCKKPVMTTWTERNY